jgi:tetratricopeptide (TPR) repeat protein
MAITLRDAGDEAGSVDTMKRARGVRQRLVDEYPKVVKYRGALAFSLSFLGLAHQRAGRLAEARNALGQSKDLWARLVTELPGQAWYGDNLGRALANLGWLEETAGNLAGALPLLQRSLAVHEQPVAADPKNTDYQRGLAYSLTYLGRVLRRLNRYEKAASTLPRAAEIAKRLVSAQTPSVDELFDLAAVQAQLSKLTSGDTAQTHAGRALELLNTAVAKGFGDAAELKASEAFDPLRERADFQKLSADLEAKLALKRP